MDDKYNIMKIRHGLDRTYELDGLRSVHRAHAQVYSSLSLVDPEMGLN